LVAVALTGYGMQDDLERYERVGFDGVLVKPVPLEDLLEVVEELVVPPKGSVLDPSGGAAPRFGTGSAG
jgi:CheY-like chemotaxis protein